MSSSRLSRLLHNERVLQSARVLIWALALVSLSALLYHLIFQALQDVKEFNGFAVNGAFQLFNALRRQASDQTPGVDFQFFHGLGVPALHYPVFLLLGKNLYASEMSRHLMSGLLFLLSTVLLLRSWRMPWPRVLLLSTAFTAAANVLGLAAVVTAGNSLQGVRSTFPLLVAAVAFAWYPRPEQPSGLHAARVRLVLGLSVTLGLSLLSGTEQGLAACGAAAVALVLTPLGAQRLPQRLLLAGAVVLGAVASWVLLLLVLTRGHPLEALRYALREVPADQFWYFGVPPNGFIFQWEQFLNDGALVWRWALGLFFFAPAAFILAWRLPPAERGELGGYVLLLVYGLASTASYLGISTPVYHEVLYRVEWMLGLYLLLHGVPRVLGAGARPWLSGWTPALTLVLFAVLGHTGFRDALTWHTQRGNIPVTQRLQVSGINLGPGWSATQALLTEALGTPGQRDSPLSVWSTYAGLLETQYGVFHPAEDYIIHALGPGARERYVERFRQVRPRYVTTIRRSYLSYEEWLQHEHWPFYEELVRHYDVRAVTGHSLLWERRPDEDTLAPQAWEGSVDPEPLATEVALPPSSEEDVLVVEVDYQVHNSRSFVPVLGQLPRYLLTLDGSQEGFPVSLPPYERRWTFAVHRRAGVTPHLQVAVLALLEGASLLLEHVRWRVLHVPEQRRLGLLDRLPAGLLPAPLRMGGRE